MSPSLDKQRPQLTIVGLGPGHPGALTLAALSAMEHARTLVLRTARHATAAWLTERGISFETLDTLYADSEDFDALSARAVRQLMDTLADKGTLCYAVADPVQDTTVEHLIAELSPDVDLYILPCVSQAAHAQAGALAKRKDQAVGAIRVVPALALPSVQYEPDLPLCVTEIDTPMLASNAKLWLLERYPPDTMVLFAAPAEDATCDMTAIPLEDFDRQPGYDQTATAWIPPVGYRQRERFGFSDLLTIMRVLRAPGGCPWDREQTHESLRPYLIEEAYEAVDAMDSGDPLALADELGDVLLQVVFHAQVGEQHGDFSIDDITSAICQKMIRRHAHIFGDVRCDTAEAVLQNWDKIKQQERGQSTQAEVLASVPKYLPALMRSAKVQKKAANVGFDWNRPQEALDKVLEEAGELRAELDAGRDPQEEAGDLLFAAVNALRLAGVQPELALSAATEKFIARFARMEAAIAADGLQMEDMSLTEMDVYWARIKHQT